MGYKRGKSKYSEQQSSEIRCNIIGALSELATFSGIDINTIKSTAPYSLVLGGITSQKISVELNKLVDSGMVVKGHARGKTMKFMLKTVYDEQENKGDTGIHKMGYGDYRDNIMEEPTEEEISAWSCERIQASADRTMYTEMW